MTRGTTVGRYVVDVSRGAVERWGREAGRLGQQKTRGWWLKRRIRTAAETRDNDCAGSKDAGGQDHEYEAGNR